MKQDKYHIILENGNIKHNIEPMFLSYEKAKKRADDLNNAIKYDHGNMTKYYVEKIVY